MSRSSSVSACSSSDRSSPMTGEGEAPERPRPPGSGSLKSYMFGRYCFSRDRTDWMFARTEWLVLTDCESGREKHVVGPVWGQKAARVWHDYLPRNEGHISHGQPVVGLRLGRSLRAGLLEGFVTLTKIIVKKNKKKINIIINLVDVKLCFVQKQQK